MIKYIITIICIILIACSAPQIVSTKDNADILFNSTVMLIRGNSSNAKCGAVAIGPNTLITTAHCVDQAPVTFYITHDSWIFGWEKQASVTLTVEKNDDLALLHSTYKLPVWAEIANYLPQNNDPICTVHHPGGLPFQLGCGFIINNNGRTKNNLGQKLDVVETSIFVVTGSSGAGLWDIDGNLIGICLAQDVNSGHAIFSKSDAVYNLSKSLPVIYFYNKGINVEF